MRRLRLLAQVLGGAAAVGVARVAVRAAQVWRPENQRMAGLMKIQMVAVLAAMSVLGASAYNRPEATKDFKKVDADESGHIDRAEVDAHLDRQFDVRARSVPRLARPATPPCYRNAAAVSTRGGCTGGSVQAEAQAWMDFYDTNKDGQVHKDEYFALPKSNARYWESVDINGDE